LEDLKEKIFQGTRILREALNLWQEKQGKKISHQANIIFYTLVSITQGLSEAVAVLDFVKHILNHMYYSRKEWDHIVSRAREFLYEEG